MNGPGANSHLNSPAVFTLIAPETVTPSDAFILAPSGTPNQPCVMCASNEPSSETSGSKDTEYDAEPPRQLSSAAASFWVPACDVGCDLLGSDLRAGTFACRCGCRSFACRLA